MVKVPTSEGEGGWQLVERVRERERGLSGGGKSGGAARMAVAVVAGRLG